MKKSGKISLKNTSILFVFGLVFMFLLMTFFLFSNYTLDYITSKFVSQNSMIGYKKLNLNCGNKIKYVCSEEIDALNISDKDKFILKLRMFDMIIISLTILGGVKLIIFYKGRLNNKTTFEK